MLVEKECPMCGKDHFIGVDDDQYAAYTARERLIQDIFPDLNPAEREFLKSGYCIECQKLLFGNGYESDKIHEITAEYLEFESEVLSIQHIEDDKEWQKREYELVCDYMRSRKCKLNQLEECLITVLGYDPTDIANYILDKEEES